MSAVIGIFCNEYLNKQHLTVVLPGTQSRRFTNVKDIVEGCYRVLKKNKNYHYSISHSKTYLIKDVAKMFSNKIKYIKDRKGERFKSAIIKSVRDKKIIDLSGKIALKNYIDSFKKIT